jgi:hypothetical protein
MNFYTIHPFLVVNLNLISEFKFEKEKWYLHMASGNCHDLKPEEYEKIQSVLRQHKVKSE